MPYKIVTLPKTSARVATVPDPMGGLLMSTISIPSKDMLLLVRNYIIGASPLAANELGLFTVKGGITQDKYKIAMLERARHLWSSRKDGCQFVPKGSVGLTRAEFELTPIEYDGKQCPDEFFGSEWETLFGTANPFEMLKKEGGAMALAAIVDTIIDSLQWDFWNLMLYGSHPIINTAETSGTYTVSEKEWDDFKDQMKNVGGFITAADYIRTSGVRDNFNVTISATDVDGESFVGDVIELFKKVREASTPTMKVFSKRRQYGRVVYLVSRGIFNAYKDHLIETFNHIPVGYQLLTTAVDGTRYAMEDVLLWDGNVVVCFDELTDVDTITGYNTHMVLAVVPGNIPFLYNTNTATGISNPATDFGLKIQQSMELKEKGTVYMYSALKVATGFINPDLVTYAVRRDPADAS